jgi:hypothetical protein
MGLNMFFLKTSPPPPPLSSRKTGPRNDVATEVMQKDQSFGVRSFVIIGLCMPVSFACPKVCLQEFLLQEFLLHILLKKEAAITS